MPGYLQTWERPGGTLHALGRIAPTSWFQERGSPGVWICKARGDYRRAPDSKISEDHIKIKAQAGKELSLRRYSLKDQAFLSSRRYWQRKGPSSGRSSADVVLVGFVLRHGGRSVGCSVWCRTASIFWRAAPR